MIKEHQEAVAKAVTQSDKMNVIKERDRRRRIKISCDQLRDLLPQFEGRRNDMASVLEMTVRYLELVQMLVPPQEQSRILSVPASLYEKWQKPTKMETLYSAQEEVKTRGRKIFPKGKKAPMKTNSSRQIKVGRQPVLADNVGISQQLSVPLFSEKPTIIPVTGSSESPANDLSVKWLTMVSSGWEHQLGENIPSCKAALLQQNSFSEGRAIQSDGPSFRTDSQIIGADATLEASASTMDPNGSNNWISETNMMEKSFYVPDLDTLTAENFFWGLART
ncbi:uncharacterized protein [Narcine bancroftii]|uniref:uncharacterized protein n=1 Tax=Narcine bancroftii TaxID=1343680 RepID=UPI003831FEA8